ncbi:XRE family transcriptional regulator [Aliihoeflea aestuarii]|jgi:transcriptional regulator with XRE-family HTH domain|uniref:XRE family transcriptional regulator n=1 Tax=Aliihoeflea aestuarii TaxID=453840 RepID=UPI00209399F5|nr:XRE family transcriptional regulator [Aliihoeflea aestuarii]MCO6390203.1 XRE family transcriptional regulator [Aliihoeflea aestuarii]
MLTGPLCRAARALVEISREKLARISGIEESVIEAFERKISRPDDAAIERLKTALEELGAVFIPEDARGAGVRIKFTESERRRIATLEGEGGIARHDDVP